MTLSSPGCFLENKLGYKGGGMRGLGVGGWKVGGGGGVACLCLTRTEVTRTGLHTWPFFNKDSGGLELWPSCLQGKLFAYRVVSSALGSH